MADLEVLFDEPNESRQKGEMSLGVKSEDGIGSVPANIFRSSALTCFQFFAIFIAIVKH